MNDGIGRARRLVEQRHLAEYLSGPKHGERLLAQPGYFTADSDASLYDEIEPIAHLPVAKDDGTYGMTLVVDYASDEFQSCRSEASEELRASELNDQGFGHLQTILVRLFP